MGYYLCYYLEEIEKETQNTYDDQFMHIHVV